MSRKNNKTPVELELFTIYNLSDSQFPSSNSCKTIDGTYVKMKFDPNNSTKLSKYRKLLNNNPFIQTLPTHLINIFSSMEQYNDSQI